MNKILIIILLLFSCESKVDQPVKYKTITKVVKAKNQAEETDYGYHYDWLNGKYRQQPEIHSVYYIVYTDGTYDKVNLGKWANINIGDRIFFKVQE